MGRAIRTDSIRRLIPTSRSKPHALRSPPQTLCNQEFAQRGPRPGAARNESAHPAPKKPGGSGPRPRSPAASVRLTSDERLRQKETRTMRNHTRTLFAAALLLFPLGAHAAYGQCTATNLISKEEFEKRGIVIDVRPDQINQLSGKSAFRNEAHITLINMNPFLFSYKLKVAQTEVQDTGFLNFLNLLGFPVSDLVGSAQNVARGKAAVIQGGNLALLINRTDGPVTLTNPKCPDETGAKEALEQLHNVRYDVLEALGLDHVDKATNDIVFKDGLKLHLDALNGGYKDARKEFLKKKGTIFDSNVDASSLCQAADGLWSGFKAHPYPDADAVDDVKKELRNFQSLVKEMKNSAQEYIAEYGECPARASGLGYARNLIRLGDELDTLGAAYGSKLNNLTDESN